MFKVYKEQCDNNEIKRKIVEKAKFLIPLTVVLKSVNHWWRRTKWFIESLNYI